MRRFEWDDKNAERHWRKHHIKFEDAKSVFSDPYHISNQDRIANDEERCKLLVEQMNGYYC